MTANVEDILKDARALSPYEQLELLQELAQSLAKTLSPIPGTPPEFWSGYSLEELAQQQNIPVVHNLQELVMPDWPEEDEVDDFIKYVKNQRTECVQC
jgi:hypothetical protein